MSKTKIPTAAEVREYLRQRDVEWEARKANHEPFVVTGPTFPNERAWLRGNTVPLLEAAERTGTPNEAIWKLCCKLSRMSHAPVAKKDYERMIPFAEKHNIEQFKRKAEWSSLDIGTLHRNMKVLEGDRPYLTPMKEKLAEYPAD